MCRVGLILVLVWGTYYVPYTNVPGISRQKSHHVRSIAWKYIYMNPTHGPRAWSLDDRWRLRAGGREQWTVLSKRGLCLIFPHGSHCSTLAPSSLLPDRWCPRILKGSYKGHIRICRCFRRRSVHNKGSHAQSTGTLIAVFLSIEVMPSSSEVLMAHTASTCILDQTDQTAVSVVGVSCHTVAVWMLSLIHI